MYTPEQQEQSRLLGLLRKEFQSMYGALCFVNPSNTKSDKDFEVIYFNLREKLGL